jgi:hypothetical protein
MRPGRRFFGEAHVAATERHLEGWYGSFKWLTSSKWCGTENLGDRYQAQFRDALQRHFPELSEFQDMAAASTRLSLGRKPVGPDLWLTTAQKHRFIEVKLPGDDIRTDQLFGLALIALFLRSDRPVSVEIIHLYSHQKPAASDGIVREFKAICQGLSSIGVDGCAGGSTADGIIPNRE